MDPITVISSISAVLGIVDQVANQIQRFKNQEPEPDVEPEHTVIATKEQPDTIVVRREGAVVETITASDIDRLDDNSRSLIKALEKSMQAQYDIWVAVYPQRDQSPDPIVNAKINQQLKGTATKMCSDLNKIMMFLDQIGKNLEDHYHHIRFICSELESA